MARCFASDNFSGIHPTIIKAIENANTNHMHAYGDDPITQETIALFKQQFGDTVTVFFVLSGTGANVLGLKTVCTSFQAILCPEQAHINVDECGAIENSIGCKIIPLSTTNGKLCVNQLHPALLAANNQHHSQPRIVSISQSTELGTVYTIDHIKELALFCHSHNMLLHMDGARLSNAAVSLGENLQRITFDAGVDIVSFGGTKNGLLCGEAVLFSEAVSNTANGKYIRKQLGQLCSKMRFISAQFKAFLTDELWKQNAEHSNAMALYFKDQLQSIPEVYITQNVEANALFVRMPPAIIPHLQKVYYFHIWNSTESIVRLMTSFDTTTEEIDTFITHLKQFIMRSTSL